ncbi:MAG: carboxypeptidase regulatory-like domain-containing protein, partial [Nannocystaceae bacterium]
MNRTRNLLKYSLALPLAIGAPVAALTVPDIAQAASDGAIKGVVTNPKNKEKVGDALVVLQCSCLQGTRETRTSKDGLYSFKNLPPGNFTIQVLTGQADVTKIVNLPRGASFRANFSIDPSNEFKRTVVVKSKPIRSDTTTNTVVDMAKMKDVPTGGVGRDFTDVVDVAPTASKDAAGIRLAGTGGDESKYQVDGANVSNPSFGTVGATIVQEFISEVEVKEAGYDAEFGGASGGIVSARRVGGSNKVRGQAVVRYTPRLAQPRLISQTDEAVRASVVTDHLADAVIVVNGPIIKDKLFFSVGVNPSGNVNSLIQSFYNRVDKDSSGGYADCEYENGRNDCVDDGNYIQTERFAEQRFRTGGFSLGYLGRIHWVINPKHTLSLSG